MDDQALTAFASWQSPDFYYTLGAGYYIHKGRLYLNGLVTLTPPSGVTTTLPGEGSALILTVPPELRPATDQTYDLMVGGALISSLDSDIEYSSLYPAKLTAATGQFEFIDPTSGGALNPVLTLPFSALLSGVSWDLAPVADTYAAGALAPYVEPLDWTEVGTPGTIVAHGSRVHLSGNLHGRSHFNPSYTPDSPLRGLPPQLQPITDDGTGGYFPTASGHILYWDGASPSYVGYVPLFYPSRTYYYNNSDSAISGGPIYIGGRGMFGYRFSPRDSSAQPVSGPAFGVGTGSEWSFNALIGADFNGTVGSSDSSAPELALMISVPALANETGHYYKLVITWNATDKVFIYTVVLCDVQSATERIVGGVPSAVHTSGLPAEVDVTWKASTVETEGDPAAVGPDGTIYLPVTRPLGVGGAGGTTYLLHDLPTEEALPLTFGAGAIKINCAGVTENNLEYLGPTWPLGTNFPPDPDIDLTGSGWPIAYSTPPPPTPGLIPGSIASHPSNIGIVPS